MFHGESTIKMDGKGRMALPTKFRDGLIERCDGKMVVTINSSREECLWLYPLDEWEVIEKKINGLSSFNRQHQLLKRYFIGKASDVEMDKNTGRILIPAKLREFARLTKDISLIGQGNKFEIWDDTRLDDGMADFNMDMDNLSGEMAGLQL